MMDYLPRVWKNLIDMQNYSSTGSSGLSDFYHRNSMAAQKEVLFMSLRPYSREQKLAQIARLKDSPNSKENSNEVIGYGRDAAGRFEVIAKQSFIQGVRMDDIEIQKHMEKLGSHLKIHQTGHTRILKFM